MSKTELLCALEAEKLWKQKCKQYCRSPYETLYLSLAKLILKTCYENYACCCKKIGTFHDYSATYNNLHNFTLVCNVYFI